MIQRIQTVYFGVAAVMFIVVAATMNRTSAETEPMAMAIMLIAGLLAIASLWSIFLFGDRGRQRQIVRWIRLGCLPLMIAIGLFAFSGSQMMDALTDHGGELLVSSLGALVGLGLLQLGAIAIKRDIALVKSMDRIR
jgi:hypothetical protein